MYHFVSIIIIIADVSIIAIIITAITIINYAIVRLIVPIIFID